MWNIDCLYFTEKVFKPIIQKQPFILLGPNRINQHLQQMGYKTYDHLFDNMQLYDTETNIIHKIERGKGGKIALCGNNFP